MLYDLTPAKEITGGPWYSDFEFDHEFIAELRNFILMCIKRMNGGYGVGNGVTLKQIVNKMIQANVSRVQLSMEEVQVRGYEVSIIWLLRLNFCLYSIAFVNSIH